MTILPPEQHSSSSNIRFTRGKSAEQTTEATGQQCSGSSDRGSYGVIPHNDMAWVLKQKPSVMTLFLECWLADSYGSRWMQLNTSLKSSAFTQAKGQLSAQGLFVFKRETSIQDGRSTVCWLVKNLHGSQVKDFGKSSTTTKIQATNTASNSSNTKIQATDTEIEAINTACITTTPKIEAINTACTSTDTAIKATDTEIEATYTACILPQTQSQSGVQKPLLSSNYPMDLVSSSISPAAESGEEELENLKKAKEEADQGDAKPEGISTPQLPTSSEDKPKTVDKPKDLDRDECSGSGGIATKQTSNEAIGEAAILKWLVEVKLPSMELNEAPRNPEAYAKAMLRRDGEALREEFGEVVRDRQFREECDSLTEKLEARVEEWRQAGVTLTLYYAFDGRPQVLLDGVTITSDEFLKMPIGSQPVLQPISAFINPEHVKNRKARQSRLKCADMLGECPGAEFLSECWQDIILRSQVKALIAKHPQWGIFVDSADQLQSWFDF